ncbi:hypothetical protein L1987_11212 [Smallanthus sonchifolius]|uniref:Uncharacterized protein n=1 Tax=Smallanthus sonchifolius TaxID=185202 RepID=A0ACB9JDS2_9ASTR|nr:hypothetical protein L1987_11212 [Smallanthus sonchifolius]
MVSSSSPTHIDTSPGDLIYSIIPPPTFANKNSNLCIQRQTHTFTGEPNLALQYNNNLDGKSAIQRHQNQPPPSLQIEDEDWSQKLNRSPAPPYDYPFFLLSL